MKFQSLKIKALALVKTDLRVLTRKGKSTRGKHQARSESSQTLAMDEDEEPSVYSHLKDLKNLKQLLEKEISKIEELQQKLDNSVRELMDISPSEDAETLRSHISKVNLKIRETAAFRKQKKSSKSRLK